MKITSIADLQRYSDQLNIETAALYSCIAENLGLARLTVQQAERDMANFPFSQWKCYEHHIAGARQDFVLVVAENNRSAAQHQRADPLNVTLKKILIEKPGIKAGQFAAELKRRIADGVISAVTETDVRYWVSTPRGEILKEVPLSGIKDRVTRIRKKGAIASKR